MNKVERFPQPVRTEADSFEIDGDPGGKPFR